MCNTNNLKKFEDLKLGILTFTDGNNLPFHRQAGIPLLQRIGVYVGGGAGQHHSRSYGFWRIRTLDACYNGAELLFEGTDQESPDTVTFTFAAPDHAFTVQSQWHLDTPSGIISRKDTLTNSGNRKLVVLRFNSKIALQSNDYEIYFQQSRWGLENQGQWTALHAGTLELGTRRGRWTEGGTPFAAVRDADSPRALAFYLLPSGDWSMKFSKPGESTNKPPLVIETGLNEDFLQYPLEPGESMAAPELLIQQLPNREVHSGSAELHRYAYANLTAPQKPLPVVYNTWLDKMDDLDVPRLRRQLTAAKRAGCEAFVIDAGWFDENRNWLEAEDRSFFGKMAEFGQEVRDAGLRFGIWIEPEFFWPDSIAVKEHPEWFECTDPVNKASSRRRMTFLTKEGEEHYYNMFAVLIRKYGLGYMKLDMNASTGMDATGRELAGYIAGLHRIMLRLRKDFPETVFENCSSGAMRTTLAELPFFDQHFVSDNANVLDVLHITQGMMLRFPPGLIFRWLTITSSGNIRPWDHSPEEFILQPQNATWRHFEETDLECGLLASMTGVLGFSGDLASLRDETLDRIRKYVDYYIANRLSLQRTEGTLLDAPASIDHRHGSISFQLSDPRKDKHYLFVFYRNCDGSNGKICVLRNLEKDGKYVVKPVFGALEGAQSIELTGEELMQDGVPLLFGCYQHGDYKGMLWEAERI